jgi:hypothetical protein
MQTGEGLDISGPISARLLRATSQIIDIYKTWEPHFTPVCLDGLSPVDRTRERSGRVAAFFSGGVDSFYTLLKNRDEITDIIFIHGFEIPSDNKKTFQDANAHVQAIAKELGVNVVNIETNIRSAIDPFVGFGYLGFGPVLVTVAQLLANTFDRIHIPSAYSYAHLSPNGSHPLLDPLWSTEALELVHDGCEANRQQKIEYVANHEIALKHLRVCIKNVEGSYNCGRCEKCVRTMIGLEAAGKLTECHLFDRPLNARSISKLRINMLNRVFFAESLAILKERGLRPDLQQAITRALRRTDMTHLRRKIRKALRFLLPDTLRNKAKKRLNSR